MIPAAARHWGQVYYLADYRRTEVQETPAPVGLLRRLATSPAAADLQRYGALLGLLLAAVVLLAVTW